MAIAASMKKRAAADLEDIAEPERDGDVPDEEGDVLKGICAVMVRSQAQWRDHPQGRVLAKTPVVDIKKLADGPPMEFPDLSKLDPPTGIRPLSGIRVLDLTRRYRWTHLRQDFGRAGRDGVACVWAEPPTTASLRHRWRSWQAERLPRPERKRRSGRQDVAGACSRRGRVLRKLSPRCDRETWFRAGAIGQDETWHRGRLGKLLRLRGAVGGPTRLRAQRPSSDRHRERIGYQWEAEIYDRLLSKRLYNRILAALGTLAALIRRAREGGSYHVRVSLCRTAMYLLEQGLNADAPTRTDVPASVLVRYMRERDSALGRLHYLGPVLRYSETPSHWDLPPAPLGAHPPHWPDWAV